MTRRRRQPASIRGLAAGQPRGHSQMTRRRRQLASVLLAAAFAAVGPLGTSPAGAQPEARLDLVAQTPRTADGPAAAVVRVTGEARGLTVRARLHQAVATRSELLAGIRAAGPVTPTIAEWEVEPGRTGAASSDLSLIVPDPGADFRAGVYPLVIELLNPGGMVADALHTHILMIPDEGTGVEPMPVALAIDLEAPVAHSPDASARIDQDGLSRALAAAEALAQMPEIPVTVEIDPQLFDALGRIGETAAIATLQAAAAGNETLLTPWTPLDVAGWVAAGRADVVLDGFARARIALEAVGIEAGAVSRVGPDRPAATAAWLASAVGAAGFVIDAGSSGPAGSEGGRARFVAGPEGSRLPAVEADHALAELLASSDPGTSGIETSDPGIDPDDVELIVYRFLAELWRMAMAGENGPMVILPPSLDGPVVEAVLAGIGDESAGLLQPLTAGALLEALSPDRPIEPDEPGGAEAAPMPPGAERRAEVEQRLRAYESLIPDDSAAAFLRDLVAAAADRRLTDDGRAELLDAVEQQATAGMGGIELLDRGRITITGRSADFPLTLMNGQSLPVTVALELASEEVDFPQGRRQLASLEPGRNEVLIQIEARSAGDSALDVVVATPEGGIVLDRGTARMRSVGRANWGLMILAAAAAGLAAWWARTVRRQRRGPGGGAATVAGTETGLGAGPTAASVPRRVP